MKLAQPVPILRIFDESVAKDFYVEFLGFKVDWEHRFANGAPLYLQVTHGDCVLHLSGHFGDCSPGAGLRVPVERKRCQAPIPRNRCLAPFTA